MLFTELAKVRDDYVAQQGYEGYIYHKTPKFITADGQRLSIEPERSIVVNHYRDLKGIKSLLDQQVDGLKIITDSDLGFRYPTAAVAGLDAPFIKRFRSEYFHKVDETRDICRPINLSYGIKSRGKADNRQEYEVWVPDNELTLDPSSLLINKYAEDLPDDVREFACIPPVIYGWMGVKRCAFEAIYHSPDWSHEIIMVLGLSIDAYNIGAKPDLSLCQEVGSSIAVSNAEFEWEVMGYYAPSNVRFSNEQIWLAIDDAIGALSEVLETHYHSSMLPIALSKTERILHTIKECGTSDEEILAMNLQPFEFLQTQSEHRTKAHDPDRKVNLLGRLNRLFYQTEKRLPSLRELHELAEQTP